MVSDRRIAVRQRLIGCSESNDKNRAVIIFKNTVKHTLTLRGADWGSRPAPDAVGAVLTWIKPLVQHTVRMGFLHSSRIVGRPLKVLTCAADIRFVGLDEGPGKSTQLFFESPIFGEAAHELYGQTQLWEDAPAEDETGLDLLGYTLTDVTKHARESNRYDSALLSRIVRFNAALKRGVKSIEITGHHLANGHTPPVIESGLIQAARELVSETPRPKRVRVQGTLDMIRVSDCAFELVLRDGERVRAVWTEKAVVPLAAYLNKPVLIEGEAVFRPSGSLLRVDAHAIASAGERDTFFSQMPTPDPSRLRVEDLHQRQTPRTGFNAIAGAWPGDETIEELLETLEEIG